MPMRDELGSSRIGISQANRRRRAHPKSARSTAPCLTIRDGIVNPNPNISRVRFAHNPPPRRVNHKITTHQNPTIQVFRRTIWA
jgi:hypothetical protein